MFAQSRSRQLNFTILAVLLALSTLLLITSITFAGPAGMIIVNPGDSIQAAINAANPGDTIVINAGTYTENLTLSKAVSLTGISNATVIIRPAGEGSILTINNSSIDNSVVISGLTFTGGFTWGYGGGLYISNDARPLIQNVVVANSSVGSDTSHGGGIYSNSPLTLIGVQLINNLAPQGAGLYLESFSSITAVMTNCQFIGNIGGGIGPINSLGPVNLVLFNTDFLSNSLGGGVQINGEAMVTGGRFENNTGGGLHASNVFVSGTEFISNSSPYSGGGIGGASVVAVNTWVERNSAVGDGGGIRAGSMLVLTNTIVQGNTAGGYGCGASAEGSASISGGLFLGNHCLIGPPWTNQGVGGGLYASGPLTLVNTDFIGNVAQTSGGVHAYSSATIIGGRFERNLGLNPYSSTGGGMRANGSLIMTGTQFISNTALVRGGGLDLGTQNGARIVNSLFADNETNGNGAGMSIYAGDQVILLNVTFANASLNPRQGIYVTYLGNQLGITNTIISNYTVGLEREYSYVGDVFEDYNLFNGNTTNLTGTVIGGTHDVFGNPNFVDPANNDYHIASSSAAFNAGVSASVSDDIDGQPRPFGSFPDIGADEYWPTSVGDLRITTAITDSSFLTTTLNWTAPLGAITYTMRYSGSAINEGNWASAINVTAPFTNSAAGSLASLNFVIPYSGGTVYVALKSQDANAIWSSLSNNAFWPARRVFLPLIRR